MKKYIIPILVGLSLVACKLDDNISPNNPSLNQVTARQRLSAAETSTYSVQASPMNGLGNVFMNSWSGNIYYYGNPLTKETNLNIDSSFYGSIWNSFYITIARLQTIIDSESSKDLPYHRAIAKILKVHYTQYLVDLYNDIPYSEAFKEGKNMSPKYDKAEDVYKGLILELNEAIKLINETKPLPTNQVSPDEDVIMKGNMQKWLKFANTVKLRYLVRQSKTTNTDAKTFVEAQLPTLKGVSFLDFDVTINPGYNSSTSDNQNPLYGAFGIRNTNNSINGSWRLYKASEHMAKILNGDTGTITEGVTDPRSGNIFVLKGGKVVGIPQGSLKDANRKEREFSWLGGLFFENADKGSASDGYIMLKSESEFLQADAAIAYPQFFSNAKEHFENGIKASFEFYGIGDKADTYIASVDSKVNVGWSATTDKVAAIQYQRWIALTNYNGMEVYLNYLKTGYPVTPLAVNAQKPNKPYRLIYPASEYTSNASNVPKMTNEDVFTINKFSPFWLR